MKGAPQPVTAEAFIEVLRSLTRESEHEKLGKFFKGEDGETRALGVKFGDVFQTARKFKSMSIDEMENLLESHYYEVRMGAVSIMD